MIDLVAGGSVPDVPFWAGVFSAGLSVICFLPYIWDTVRRRTQPDRACWLIWAVLSSISFASQWHEGATTSLWFAAAQCGGTLLICGLSIVFGAGRYFSRRNLIIFLIAGLGLVAWYFTDRATYALAIAISISLLGGMTTIYKSYLAPESETLSTWVIAFGASILGFFSVGSFDPILLAYPVYLLVLYIGILGAIGLGRWRQRIERQARDMILAGLS